MKKLIAAFLSAAMVMSVAGCSIPKLSGSSTTRITGTLAQQSDSEAPSATEAAVIKPGNYIQNSKFKISFEKAKQYDEISTGKYHPNTPDNGKKYLVLFFEIENVSEEDQYLFSFGFKGFEDGYEAKEAYLLDEIEGYPSLDNYSGALSKGKKRKVYLAYEVNPDWKQFEVTYQEMGDPESYDFIVTPEDLS